MPGEADDDFSPRRVGESEGMEDFGVLLDTASVSGRVGDIRFTGSVGCRA